MARSMQPSPGSRSWPIANIFDEDILALVSDEHARATKEQLVWSRFASTARPASARRSAEIVFPASMNGKGARFSAGRQRPYRGIFSAIEAHVQSGAEMVLHSVNAISGSTGDRGEVTVCLQNAGRVVNGA